MGHIIADIVFVLAGLLIVLLSAKRGFFGTLMRFAKTFLAIAIAYLFGDLLAPWVSETVPALGDGFVAVAVSYIVTFVLALLLLTVVTWLMRGLIKRLAVVRALDGLLGALIGIVIAAMVMFVAASIIKIIPAAEEMYAGSTVIKLFGESTWLHPVQSDRWEERQTQVRYSRRRTHHRCCRRKRSHSRKRL